jgi:MAP/microtubule affinity-regulating kinase
LCYVIGRGAFAKVCLGVQILTGQLVAMKIIEKSSLKTESAKKRIIQEVIILKQLLIYPGIIKLFEVFETKK